MTAPLKTVLGSLLLCDLERLVGLRQPVNHLLKTPNFQLTYERPKIRVEVSTLPPTHRTRRAPGPAASSQQPAVAPHPRQMLAESMAEGIRTRFLLGPVLP